MIVNILSAAEEMLRFAQHDRGSLHDKENHRDMWRLGMTLCNGSIVAGVGDFQPIFSLDPKFVDVMNNLYLRYDYGDCGPSRVRN